MHLTQRCPAQRPSVSQSQCALQHAVEEKAACAFGRILGAAFTGKRCKKQQRSGVACGPSGGAHGPEVHCRVVEGRAFSFVWEDTAARRAGSVTPGAGGSGRLATWRVEPAPGLRGRGGRVCGRRPRVSSWRGVLFVISDKKCHFYH
jgi:hypothetical protein